MNNWFTKLCRKSGLVIHHAITPAKKNKSNKRVVRHDVEEQKLNDNVTLRRTTIEEIEIKKNNQ